MNRITWALLGVLLIARTAAAQTTTATIVGTVSDSSGATIPEAAIQIRNTQTGAARSLSTDVSGRYTAPDVAPGEYEAEASKTGFASERRQGILLTVGSNAVIDFSLPVGQKAETVQVTAEASQVETTSAAITNLVNQRQMTELPLNAEAVFRAIRAKDNKPLGDE